MGDLSESTKIVWYIYLVILHTFCQLFPNCTENCVLWHTLKKIKIAIQEMMIVQEGKPIEYMELWTFKKNVYSKLKITNNMLPDVLLIYKNPIEEMNRLHEPIIQL